MKYIAVLTLFVALAAIAGCNKTNNGNIHPHTIRFNSAGLVRNYGAPASDGCGWLLVLDNGRVLKPDNLDQSFLKDSLKVVLSYDTLQTQYECGLSATTKYRIIHITTIAVSGQ